jgi:hypothetical protein
VHDAIGHTLLVELEVLPKVADHIAADGVWLEIESRGQRGVVEAALLQLLNQLPMLR